MKYLFIFIFIVNGCFSFAAKKDSSDEKISLNEGEVFLDLISPEEWKEVNKTFHPDNLTEKQVEAIRGFLINNQKRNEAVINTFKPREDKLRMSLWNHQIKGFPMEALVFYAAIGATMWRKAYTDASFMGGGRRDPRWLENFVHEITSPVGVFSFFCFVLASGTASHLYSKLTYQMTPLVGSVLRAKGINHAFSSIESRSTKMKYGANYRTTRWGLRTVGTFSGQLGMAFGLLASDVVHELHTQYFHSPNAEKCADDLMKSEAKSLACSLMWDDIGQKAVAFLPGLASMLTASMLSHVLVRGVFTAGAAVGNGAKNTVIKSALLPRVSMVVAGKIPWRMIANVALWLIPVTSKVQVGRAILGTARAAKVFGSKAKVFGSKAGHLVFKFVNLYAFMEVEQFFTHGLWDSVWGEGLKANAVAKSMDDFLQHHNVNRSTPYRRCKGAQEEEECEYHPGILDVHLVSNRFNQWRQYKLQEASMAHQNWFLYVSNAIGSFDLAREVYKNFFLAKKESAHFFNKVNYFGDVEEEKAKASFSDMLKMIDQHIEVNAMSDPEELNLDIVSPSPSRFLKPIKELNVRTKDRLFVLRALFAAQDPYIPLPPFYGSEWEKVSRDNRRQVLNSYMNPNKLIRDYFEYLEKSVVSLKEMLNKVSEQVSKRMNSLSEKELMALREELKLDKRSGLEDVKSAFEKERRLVLLDGYFKTVRLSTAVFLKQSEESVLAKFRLPNPDKSVFVYLLQLASRALEREINDQLNEGSFLKWYFTGWMEIVTAVDAFASRDNNVVSNEVIQRWLDREWNRVIQSTKKEILGESSVTEPLPIDERKIENLLRKKVLAAGVEYLNHIVKLEKKARRGHRDYRVHFEIRKEKEKGIKFPGKVEAVFFQLGMEDIFAKLYQLTFIKHDNGEYVQMTPKTRGMNEIEKINNDYKMRTKTDEVKYHPSRLKFLRTPYVMDFLVSSVLCGSDLRGKKHTDLIKLITSILSEASSSVGTSSVLEKKFSKRSGGVLGQLADIGQGMLEGKLLLLQAMETKFPGLEMSEIIDQLPVFGRVSFPVFDHIPSSGISYTFYPPRLDMGIDEKIRKAICWGDYSQTPHRVVENIYDSHFPTEVKSTSWISWPFEVGTYTPSPDKEYSNLLHLVLNHIGSGEISSLEEFNKWWKDNVEPYQQIFLLAADREYKRIVEYGFIKPLFQNGVKKMEADSTVAVNDPFPTLSQCEEDASVWDNVSILSRDWVYYEGSEIRYPVNDEVLMSPYCVKTYSAELPRGVFQNMYFELHYWADIILHFGKQRIEAFKKHPGIDKGILTLMDIKKLEENLRVFIEKFKMNECLSTEEELENKNQIQVCLEWGRQFLSAESGKKFEEIFENLAKILFMDQNILLANHDPFAKKYSGDSEENLSKKERERRTREAFSSFEKIADSARVIGNHNDKMAPLPDQFINFALIRLRQIFDEVVQYVSMTGFISESPGVLKARSIDNTGDDKR